MLFTQAAGNATEEALRRGADNARATLYGAAVGGVEVLTEKMFGGIPGLGSGGFDEMIEGAVKRSVQSEAAQRAVLLFVDALGEGVEEFTGELADEFVGRGLMPGYDARSGGALLSDAGYSFLIGAAFLLTTRARRIK